MQGKLFALNRGFQAGLVLAMAIVACIAANALAADDQQSFGERQLSQVLEDRPNMKEIVDADDFIHEWVIRQFEGDSPDRRVYWDNQEPESGRPSECEPAFRSFPRAVCVTKSESFSGRDKWAFLIFELNNLKNSEGFNELDRRAYVGQINRTNYSVECTALEFRATIRTQLFLRCHPIPGSSAKEDPYYTEYLNPICSFNEYIKMLDAQAPEEYDPRDYWGKAYDSTQYGGIPRWAAWLNSRQRSSRLDTSTSLKAP